MRASGTSTGSSDAGCVAAAGQPFGIGGPVICVEGTASGGNFRRGCASWWPNGSVVAVDAAAGVGAAAGTGWASSSFSGLVSARVTATARARADAPVSSAADRTNRRGRSVLRERPRVWLPRSSSASAHSSVGAATRRTSG
jgi:hypothetical protein